MDKGSINHGVNKMFSTGSAWSYCFLKSSNISYTIAFKSNKFLWVEKPVWKNQGKTPFEHSLVVSLFTHRKKILKKL